MALTPYVRNKYSKHAVAAGCSVNFVRLAHGILRRYQLRNVGQRGVLGGVWSSEIGHLRRGQGPPLPSHMRLSQRRVNVEGLLTVRVMRSLGNVGSTGIGARAPATQYNMVITYSVLLYRRCEHLHDQYDRTARSLYYFPTRTRTHQKHYCSPDTHL